MPVSQDDDHINQQPISSSKKDEDKRKQYLFAAVLKLKPNMIQHPVVATLLQKYAKQQQTGYGENAFKLDFIRMMAMYRISIK